MYNLRYD